MKFKDLDIEDSFWAYGYVYIKIHYIQTLKCNAVRVEDRHLCLIPDDQEVLRKKAKD